MAASVDCKLKATKLKLVILTLNLLTVTNYHRFLLRVILLFTIFSNNELRSAIREEKFTVRQTRSFLAISQGISLILQYSYDGYGQTSGTNQKIVSFLSPRFYNLIFENPITCPCSDKKKLKVQKLSGRRNINGAKQRDQPQVCKKKKKMKTLLSKLLKQPLAPKILRL